MDENSIYLSRNRIRGAVRLTSFQNHELLYCGDALSFAACVAARRSYRSSSRQKHRHAQVIGIERVENLRECSGSISSKISSTIEYDVMYVRSCT